VLLALPRTSTRSTARTPVLMPNHSTGLFALSHLYISAPPRLLFRPSPALHTGLHLCAPSYLRALLWFCLIQAALCNPAYVRRNILIHVVRNHEVLPFQRLHSLSGNPFVLFIQGALL